MPQIRLYCFHLKVVILQLQKNSSTKNNDVFIYSPSWVSKPAWHFLKNVYFCYVLLYYVHNIVKVTGICGCFDPSQRYFIVIYIQL